MVERPTDNDVKIAEIRSRQERWIAIIRAFTWLAIIAALYLPLTQVRGTFASFAGEETIVSLNWPVAAVSLLGVGAVVRLAILEVRVRKQRDRIEELESELMDREGRIDELERTIPAVDNKGEESNS